VDWSPGATPGGNSHSSVTLGSWDFREGRRSISDTCSLVGKTRKEAETKPPTASPTVGLRGSWLWGCFQPPAPHPEGPSGNPNSPFHRKRREALSHPLCSTKNPASRQHSTAYKVFPHPTGLVNAPPHSSGKETEFLGCSQLAQFSLR
jgi:hypothetical protein